MRSRGFSLLELMIVLSIIATLTSIAIPNLVRARAAANESAAIALVKTFCTSEEIYRRTDWDANGTMEYAQNIGPNGGNANSESLYFNIKGNRITGLMDASVANAEIPNTGIYTGTTPRSGYIFFVQLGTSYPSVTSYVNAKGSMTTGYSLCGVPHQYGFTGNNTFQMSSNGVIYAKDQGSNSLVAAYNVNPANNWLVSQ